jgi:hypothetical protein
MTRPAVVDSTPVEEALAQLHDGNPFWARPLVAALEGHRPGASVCLAVEWLRSLLGDANPTRLADLSTFLQELRQLNETRDVDPEQVLRVAQDVWYRPPRRDPWQTALARLYEALACRYRGEPGSFMKQVTSAINVAAESAALGPAQTQRLRQLYFDCWNKSEG